MTKIEKQFVPYEQSLKLRDLGFDEGCFGWNFINSKVFHIEYINNQTDYELLRPLWQQAFDWFREHKGLYSTIQEGYVGRIMNIPEKEDHCTWGLFTDRFDEYEDARIACLDKLIELCQKK